MLAANAIKLRKRASGNIHAVYHGFGEADLLG
jgi:hypothetical protein